MTDQQKMKCECGRTDVHFHGVEKYQQNKWKIETKSFTTVRFGESIMVNKDNDTFALPVTLLDQIRREAKKELLDEIETELFQEDDGIRFCRWNSEATARKYFELRAKTLGEKTP